MYLCEIYVSNTTVLHKYKEKNIKKYNIIIDLLNKHNIIKLNIILSII